MFIALSTRTDRTSVGAPCECCPQLIFISHATLLQPSANSFLAPYSTPTLCDYLASLVL